MIPCAYLRVFRTLDGFAEPERSAWERYIVRGGRSSSSTRPVYREAGFAADARVGLLTAAEDEQADIRLIGDRYYVCPWRTRLRVLASILSLKETVPVEMAQVFVTDGDARRAARELARMKRREPQAVPSMLQSPWHVPVRWFVLTDEPDRTLTECADGDYRLSYWTPIGVAKERAERAVRAIRRTELRLVGESVRDLIQWLSSFPPDSAVELDYGSVSALFSWDELDDDHSAREVQESVRALSEPGGMERAMEIYQSVAMRWAEARSRESLN